MGSVRYRRLRAQMAMCGVNRRALSGRVGMSYAALCRKINGLHPFTLEEAVRIKRALRYADAVDLLFDMDGEESGREEK